MKEEPEDNPAKGEAPDPKEKGDNEDAPPNPPKLPKPPLKGVY